MQNGLHRLSSLLRVPVLALSLCGLLAQPQAAHAANVGDELKNAEVRDGNNQPASLPSVDQITAAVDRFGCAAVATASYRLYFPHVAHNPPTRP